LALYKLEEADLVSEGYLKQISLGEKSVVLACGASGPRAVEPYCPHAGGSMAAGKVIGDRLRCPMHGYMFDLRTGYCPRASREGFQPLRTAEVKNLDGCLYLEVRDGADIFEAIHPAALK
jgi:nitrite reductase/ring-hydroxylating ferredoxin subunit